MSSSPDDPQAVLRRLVLQIICASWHYSTSAVFTLCTALNDHVTENLKPEQLHPEFLELMCDEAMWDYIYDACKRDVCSHDEAPIRVIGQDFHRLFRNRQLFATEES